MALIVRGRKEDRLKTERKHKKTEGKRREKII
jgi:hypothetical protein